MHFLVPLFLAALGALAVPVLLHVRRQLPRERVPFSAVMFLDEAAPRTRRRMRLQDLLLLLLRCLGLALLAFAFARPFFGSDSILAATPPIERLILIDTSASMRGDRFERAKKEAETLVGKSGGDDTIAVATFDHALSVKLPFEASQKLPASERRSAAAAAIRALQPGWFDTNLGALNDAADLADQSRESSDTPAEIFVVSDFQHGAAVSDLAGAAWPQRTQIIPVPISSEGWTNAGIHPANDRQSPQQLRVANSEGSQNDAFTVSASGAPAQSLEVAPGESRFVTLHGAGAAVQADLAGDPFDFDNHAWFLPKQKTSLTVDYLGAADPANPQDTLFFLARALQSTPDYTIDFRVRAKPGKTAPALTILDGAIDASAVKQRLEAGGNALLLLRDTASAATAAALAGAPLRSEEVAATDEPALIGGIDFENPIFQPFADPRFSNFSRINTWHYRRIDPAALPGARTLATFSSGDPALLRAPVGRGSLYILTTTWRPADSQLALSTKFVPLLHSMLRQSAGLEPRDASVWVGDEVHLPPGAEPQVTAPDGKTLPAAGGIFTATTMPGIYRTTDGAFSFAVNPRPGESELTPLSAAELRALGLPLDQLTPAAADKSQLRAMAAEELEHRQKWWWWLIVGAVAVFILETALAAWTTKRRMTAALA